ncbi:MAG: MMPL family transporter [Actinomycetota bacterium]
MSSPTQHAEDSMLARIARWCFRHRWLTIIIWIATLVGGSAVAQGVMGGDRFETRFSIPQTESRRALELLDEAFPNKDSVTDAQLVVEAPQGIDDPAVKSALSSLFLSVTDGVPGLRLTSPYELPNITNPAGGERLISSDRTIAYAELGLPAIESQEGQTLLGERIMEVANEHLSEVPLPDGVSVEFGGDPFVDFELPESEVVGLLAAIIILVLAFGSVLAMGLPIGTALIGLGTGVAIITMISHLMEMPDFSLQIGAMIGIGVGIDYALFIVTRYREGLRSGMSPEDATVVAADTAGRAVLFAGITVMISLLGMYMMGMAFVYGLAIAGSVAVGFMVLAALTLLPALLSLVRHRIDVTTRAALASLVVFATLSLVGVIFLGTLSLLPVGLLAAVVIMALSFLIKSWRKPIAHREPKPREEQLWFRWSRLVQRRPWTSFALGLASLIALTLPLFGMRLALSDNGNRAEWQTARRAYDLLARGFGPGFSGPLTLVGEVPADASADDIARANESLTAALRSEDGVAYVSEPMAVTPELTLWKVVPTTAPQDEATSELVHHLRDQVIPGSLDAANMTEYPINVGGFTAIAVDLSDYFGQRVFIFIAAVLVLSFLLLMAVFRSLLVPLKAVLMNLLSIGAAYGVVVAVFQWGWLADLIGVGRAGPIEPFIPMMLFAIVFGLSMDYEVFLLSRVKEEFDRTGDNSSAVADGLTATARVITAAALIMVAVFGSFVAGDDRTVKLFGLGLAVAVFIDATLVRMVLVPATMELLGARNWWIPKWLDRLLPRIDVEGHANTVGTERT